MQAKGPWAQKGTSEGQILLLLRVPRTQGLHCSFPTLAELQSALGSLQDCEVGLGGTLMWLQPQKLPLTTHFPPLLHKAMFMVFLPLAQNHHLQEALSKSPRLTGVPSTLKLDSAFMCNLRLPLYQLENILKLLLIRVLANCRFSI